MKTTDENSFPTKFPYDRFQDFISPRADRFTMILKCIEKLGLLSEVITVANNRHIFIFPPGQKSLRLTRGVFPFKDENPFLLSAHYDRVEGSQGANDNSISVFHLLRAASVFMKQQIDRWLIVFTDKEELKTGETLEMQGSFTLAGKLRSWGLDKARVYNFDACGCGSAFIFSTTTDNILKNSEKQNLLILRNNIRQLRDHALKTANHQRLEKVLLAPTPFSDDVGFLRAGFAAQTITILPVEEADQFESILRSRDDLADLIITGKIRERDE